MIRHLRQISANLKTKEPDHEPTLRDLILVPESRKTNKKSRMEHLLCPFSIVLVKITDYAAC